jgi:hypothetical protein
MSISACWQLGAAADFLGFGPRTKITFVQGAQSELCCEVSSRED